MTEYVSEGRRTSRPAGFGGQDEDVQLSRGLAAGREGRWENGNKVGEKRFKERNLEKKTKKKTKTEIYSASCSVLQKHLALLWRPGER